MSDIRVQNTKNNLIAALLSCLEDESFHKLKVKDIIDKAGVSTRTFYQYYSDVNDLLRDIEDSFMAEYLKNVEKDRDSLGDLDLDTPFEDQLENILNATKNTIEFCYAHKKEIQVLLSDNGANLSLYSSKTLTMPMILCTNTCTLIIILICSFSFIFNLSIFFIWLIRFIISSQPVWKIIL